MVFQDWSERLWFLFYDITHEALEAPNQPPYISQVNHVSQNTHFVSFSGCCGFNKYRTKAPIIIITDAN